MSRRSVVGLRLLQTLPQSLRVALCVPVYLCKFDLKQLPPSLPATPVVLPARYRMVPHDRRELRMEPGVNLERHGDWKRGLGKSAAVVWIYPDGGKASANIGFR